MSCSGSDLGLESQGDADVALATEAKAEPALKPFATSGWSRVDEQLFTYLDQHLPSPTCDVGNGEDGSDAGLHAPDSIASRAAQFMEELEEKCQDKESSGKDKTKKSIDDFTLAELLAPSPTQKGDLNKAGFNRDSDDALVLIARAVGVSINRRHFDGCLLAEYVAGSSTWDLFKFWGNLHDHIDCMAPVPLLSESSRTSCTCTTQTCLMRRRPSAGGQNLRHRMRQLLAVVTNKPHMTTHKYARGAQTFLVWLHLRHPECFRQTPVCPSLSA